jgi:hypothetical protein
MSIHKWGHSLLPITIKFRMKSNEMYSQVLSNSLKCVNMHEPFVSIVSFQWYKYNS